jgi:hypothetical protein
MLECILTNGGGVWTQTPAEVEEDSSCHSPLETPILTFIRTTRPVCYILEVSVSPIIS